MDLQIEKRSASGCELVAEVAHRFGEVRLSVTGASMMPVIWPGDVLTVRRCGEAELQPGQIVLYRREGKLVAHRITRIHDNLLTTRGDSVSHDDSPVRKSEIVGQVISLLRRGRCVALELSFWRRAGCCILQRSDFCLRAMLLLVRCLRRPGEEGAWA
jgi:signal peptidase I